MLLNTDKPRQTAVLHSEGCPSVPVPTGTRHKPFSILGRDGGWLAVGLEVDAKIVASKEMPSAQFMRCLRCEASTALAGEITIFPAEAASRRGLTQMEDGL